MGKVRIGVISPYPEFTDTVMQVAGDMNLDVRVRQEMPENASSVIDWEKEGGVEVVVARGSTAMALKKRLKIPVTAIEITSFDVAEALYRARSTGKNITLVDFQHIPMRLDYRRISGIVGIDFKAFNYQSENDLDRILQEVFLDKNSVIVGTATNVVQKALELGLESILVHSSRECIHDVLKKAGDICRVRRRDLRLCSSFQAILNNAYDGILAVEKGEVTIFNPVVEKTTGLRADEVLGRPISEICRANPKTRTLYGDGRAITGQLVYLSNITLVVNRVPVLVGQNNQAMMITFQAADRISRTEAKIRRELHHQGLVARFRFSDIVGHSAMITETIREARKYARSEAAVLIAGESGTGKELFAQSMHNESSRREGPFVAINCAALPENLLESELFGYEDGAFTGARKGGKQGLFTLAHGGTIFLDEVTELSPALQARLLRVLQEKEVMPVGGQRVIPVDVRVISATNLNLVRAVNEGRFRKDLYFRLNVLNLQIPPLRDRLEDVPELFVFFLKKLSGPNIVETMNIDNNLPEALKRYMWPGNVRELEGFSERYVALGEDNIKTHSTFYGLLKKLTTGADCSRIKGNINQVTIDLGNMLDMEKQILTQASKLIRGNKGDMAKILGISRTTLWKKLKDLELQLPDDDEQLH